MLERLQSCPGVIALEDVFEDADNVMIVTELCSGGDLQGLSEVRCTHLTLYSVICAGMVSKSVLGSRFEQCASRVAVELHTHITARHQDSQLANDGQHLPF